ncbi:MAG TPA: energy transducer TonB [Gemmatimonadales bacterium]|nr:energy transducer TonB [Gemmatimonadales bacterium]
MLERLVASGAHGSSWRATPGAVLSAALHGLVVAGAVAATRAAAPPASPPRDLPVIDLAFPAPSEPRGRTDGAGGVFSVPGPITVDHVDFVPFPVNVPDGIAPSVPGAGGSPWAGPGNPDGRLWVQGRGDSSVLVLEAVADEPPLLLTRPELEYPAPLRYAGITGRVVIEVIIGADGVPEADSFRIVEGSRREFEQAARRVVLGARFRPGRWRGRPVRVLIRQPVEFRLRA